VFDAFARTGDGGGHFFERIARLRLRISECGECLQRIHFFGEPRFFSGAKFFPQFQNNFVSGFLADTADFGEVGGLARTNRTAECFCGRDIQNIECGFWSDAGYGNEEFKESEFVCIDKPKEFFRVLAHAMVGQEPDARAHTECVQGVVGRVDAVANAAGVYGRGARADFRYYAGD